MDSCYPGLECVDIGSDYGICTIKSESKTRSMINFLFLHFELLRMIIPPNNIKHNSFQ